MFVIHTTTFEVYSRTWTVHEVDEGVAASITMEGLFDINAWTETDFDAALAVDTSESKCRPEDRTMLEEQISRRGGFARLDQVIVDFRVRMKKSLVMLLSRYVYEVTNPTIYDTVSLFVVREWCYRFSYDHYAAQIGFGSESDEGFYWRHTQTWVDIMRQVQKEMGATELEVLPTWVCQKWVSSDCVVADGRNQRARPCSLGGLAGSKSYSTQTQMGAIVARGGWDGKQPPQDLFKSLVLVAR